jgi:hypothetical protein
VGGVEESRLVAWLEPCPFRLLKEGLRLLKNPDSGMNGMGVSTTHCSAVGRRSNWA